MLKHILFLLFCMAIYANVGGISLAQTKSTQLPDGFFNPEKGDLLDKTEEFPLPDSIYDPETGEYIPVSKVVRLSNCVRAPFLFFEII